MNPFPRTAALLLGLLLAGCRAEQQATDASPIAALPAPAGSTAATAAASPSRPSPPPAAQPARIIPQAQFSDELLGIAILPAPRFTLRRDFRRDYLAADGWKAFADPDSEGTPVVALVLDGSDNLTAAELRLGSSDDEIAVADCLKVSDSAQPGTTDDVRIDGQPFRHFRASDAAMSHYLSVDAYRAVRHGRCFAIDLLIAGTRPEVYDPPRIPPFSENYARRHLQQALAAIRFTR